MIKISKILKLLAQGKTLQEISIQTSNDIQDIKNKILELADEYDIEQDNTIIKPELIKDDELIVYTDGAARGNPGPSGIACVVYNLHNQEVANSYKFIGKATNNTAEYRALLLSLNLLEKFPKIKKINFFSDSELLVRQIQGRYKVSSPNILKYYTEFMQKIKKYSCYSITHIKREKNKRADELANKAIEEDQRLKIKD